MSNIRARRRRNLVAGGAAVIMVTLAATAPALAAGPDWLTWGQNNQGQLCDGSFTNRTTPVFPALAPGTTIVAIAAGRADTSYAVFSTGIVVACGNNQFGQLGDGTTTTSNSPVTVLLPVGTVATSVCAGTDFAAALTSIGSVLAWGRNQVGQLGNSTNTDSLAPVSVSLPPATTVTAIACGWEHMLAMTSTGDVLSWGSDLNGALGNGLPLANSNVPVVPTLPGGFVAIAIAANGYHSIALDSTGVPYVWGDGLNGALCNGSSTDSNVPITVTLPGGATSTAVGAGANHSLFVTSTGGVFGCGENNNGELGIGNFTSTILTPTATILPVGTVVTAVAGGSEHSLYLTNAGKVLASGFNSSGQLGIGNTTQQNLPVAALVGAGTTLNLIAAGFSQSMAVGMFSLTGVPLANSLFLTAGLALLLAGAALIAVRRHGAGSLR